MLRKARKAYGSVRQTVLTFFFDGEADIPLRRLLVEMIEERR